MLADCNLVDSALAGAAVTQDVWWKLAGASAAATCPFTWETGQRAYGWIMRFTGHDPDDAVDATSVATNISNSPASLAVSTGVDNALILRLGCFQNHSVTLDVPTPPGHQVITKDASGRKVGTEHR